MKTAIVVSTRGFGVFRHDLLADPDDVRFVGIFTEQDIVNVTDEQRAYFHRIHVVPNALEEPSPMLESLVDPEATRTILRSLLAENGLDDVSLHCYDEQNILFAAELRLEFGIDGPGPDDILPYRDKVVMKNRLVAAGVRVPRFGRFQPEAFVQDEEGYFQRIVGQVGLPFILKPVDSAGGDGVFLISSYLDFAALPASFGRTYEYEEFISGTMYSVNIMTRDGRTVFGGVTEYLVTAFDVQHGKVNADINLIDHDPRVARMVRFAEQALDALGRLDGASHLELFLADDDLVFLEVAARFKGIAGLAAMQRNYGIAFVNMALDIEAGIESHPYPDEQVFCFDGVIPKRRGRIEKLIEPDLESDCEMEWKVRPGEKIGQSNSLIANGGTFLVSNKDYDILYRDFGRLSGYVPIIYEGNARS